ncbi:hypothetical protein [Mangrovicoccus ximenensis]|nr:hypothetical protein [Mangrovicoccus ximenensis]
MDNIKAAAILGGAILLATAAHIYFSPYWTCVRVYGGGDYLTKDCMAYR